MKKQLSILVLENGGKFGKLVEPISKTAPPDEFVFRRVYALADAHRILERNSPEARPFAAIVLDLDAPPAGTDRKCELSALVQLRKKHPHIPIVALTRDGDGPGDGRQDADLEGLVPQEIIHKDDLNPRLLRRVLRHVVRRQETLVRLQEGNSLLAHKNRQLTRLYETANQFVDNISHEFRTPLTVIKEFASIIGEGLAGEVTQQQQEFLRIINDRTDDLAVMVDDMLDTSKLEAGLLSVWRRRCNVADVVQRVRDTLQRKAEVKKVGFKIVVPGELPEVYCDPEKIGRVIINLVVNSIKFTPCGGSVRLSAAHNHENSEILLSVEDNGPGIERHELERIFQRFHQAAKTACSAAQGVGLGLNIAKELVELNLGRIEVASTPGRGSTFSFSVPLFDPPNLVKRHMRRLRISSGRACELSLLVAAIEPQINAPAPTAGCGLSIVVDEFLQHAFRGDDLVIRSHANKWVILSTSTPEKTDKLITRVQSEWVQLNRNRPGEEFPAICLRYKGTWSTAEQEIELQKQHHLEMHAEPDKPPSPRVLVVDDDNELTRGLGIRLQAAGYEVMTANDGHSGLAAAVDSHPDAILMDNYMPGLGGIEVLSRLRQNPDTNDIPVIMLSGGIHEQQLALKRGARYFLHKPCDPKTVAAAIRDVIATKGKKTGTAGRSARGRGITDCKK